MTDPTPDPVEIAKTDKRAEIEGAYETYVTGDFSSTALGDTKWYSSDHESQVNLIGARLAGIDLSYRCGGSKGGLKTFTAHTAAQLQQVFLDGVAYKHAGIVKYQGLMDDIDAATTSAEVNAISW